MKVIIVLLAVLIVMTIGQSQRPGEQVFTNQNKQKENQVYQQALMYAKSNYRKIAQCDTRARWSSLMKTSGQAVGGFSYEFVVKLDNNQKYRMNVFIPASDSLKERQRVSMTCSRYV